MAMDLSKLTQAINALEKSFTLAETQAEKINKIDLTETVKAGVIHHFKVAYELCWKFIQRWIRENKTPEDADQPRTRKELFRMAARYQLIQDPLPWFNYSDARNLTSHTYDESKADTVYSIIKNFINDAKFLLTQLEQHND